MATDPERDGESVGCDVHKIYCPAENCLLIQSEQAVKRPPRFPMLDMCGDTATNIGLVFGVWLVVDCFVLGQPLVVWDWSGHL